MSAMVVPGEGNRRPEANVLHFVVTAAVESNQCGN